MEAPIENVDGRILEENKHIWSHEVSHQVNWSYVGLAIAAIVLAYFLFYHRGSDGDQPDENGQPEAGGFVTE